ncbi:DUF1014-domain-containing protein [Caenorhabditis elegans]|uniref:DUF1014-domain-containing protein n=1 Tax=Caenorhabditis elegans TaxID=6239 RepID=Q2PJ80_CAEEL|nr:DUF1014-domain-containing protein [Caenorhabditis elegans]CCD70206.1 DUF1014-domain-containing protein [Caenorhabditis elegans]|eukprot:NP_001040976.1 Uncharacterized protein CELE_M02B7.7 [Caenorhabditis elegans]
MSAKQKQMQDFLNRKRKMDLNVEKEPEPSTSSEPSNAEPVDVEEAKKEKQKYEKAKKAILFEAKRAKERADEMGPQGYLKPKSLGTNKEFLRRTIESTMPRRGKEDSK